MRIARARFDDKAAESLGIAGLTFLASDPEQIARFIALTGIGPGEIRRLAAERGFLAAVLGHLCDHETLLMEFAAQEGCDPADVDRARIALAGDDWERETA